MHFGGGGVTFYSVPVPNAHEDLLRLFNKKCDRIDKRGHEYRLAPIDRPQLWDWFYESYKKAFYCSYCGVDLTTDSSDQARVFSFDHYVPISKKGDNSIRNLELVCNACNTVKSRLNAETFSALIEAGGRELVVRMFYDQKEAFAPKVQPDSQCSNCYHLNGEKCTLGFATDLARPRDSDWCGRWNA